MVLTEKGIQREKRLVALRLAPRPHMWGMVGLPPGLAFLVAGAGGEGGEWSPLSRAGLST